VVRRASTVGPDGRLIDAGQPGRLLSARTTERLRLTAPQAASRKAPHPALPCSDNGNVIGPVLYLVGGGLRVGKSSLALRDQRHAPPGLKAAIGGIDIQNCFLGNCTFSAELLAAHCGPRPQRENEMSSWGPDQLQLAVN
jgi:hypothetical protein